MAYGPGRLLPQRDRRAYHSAKTKPCSVLWCWHLVCGFLQLQRQPGSGVLTCEHYCNARVVHADKHDAGWSVRNTVQTHYVLALHCRRCITAAASFPRRGIATVPFEEWLVRFTDARAPHTAAVCMQACW